MNTHWNNQQLLLLINQSVSHPMPNGILNLKMKTVSNGSFKRQNARSYGFTLAGVWPMRWPTCSLITCRIIPM